MAKNIRQPNTEKSMNKLEVEQIKIECERQEENCLYTSTTFFLWLRVARCWKVFFIVAPIILGAVAGWSVLETTDGNWKVIASGLALLAGIFPAVYEALNLNMQIDTISSDAAKFKNLQDRFRQMANIKCVSPDDTLSDSFEGLISELENARSSSLTPPEKYFKRAQVKIGGGHYDHTAS